jgi:hypothetical protein
MQIWTAAQRMAWPLVPASLTSAPGANRFRRPALAGRERTKDRTMKDATTYRQYAAECRRIAQTMNEQDRATLVQMAELWESSAREAVRLEAKQKPNGEPRAPA